MAVQGPGAAGPAPRGPGSTLLDGPFDYEERLTLLRSGPFARVRRQVRDDRGDGFERATLARPDHLLRASRSLAPKRGPWTIDEDAQAYPPQAYRQALWRAESPDSFFFDATHGGATLLQYPQILRGTNSSPDFEVVKLSSTTKDGHRLVTLRLRTNPEVKGRDRNDITYVFDADDLCVVRSIHYEAPEQKLVSTCRYAYDHSNDRPVLRSWVTTIPARHRALRLDAEECRFEPISESEFAVEPFLASLGPGRPNWPPAAEPRAATPLVWYWLAFVIGGINVAGGSGLALGSRYRTVEWRLLAKRHRR
ncbi:MAG: hypothetical protein ACP5XB_25965 [Isosphaeraceae bacterium]